MTACINYTHNNNVRCSAFRHTWIGACKCNPNSVRA
nr:MAG TPA: hypothetical protein [Bacteriophage sp.]